LALLRRSAAAASRKSGRGSVCPRVATGSAEGAHTNEQAGAQRSRCRELGELRSSGTALLLAAVCLAASSARPARAQDGEYALKAAFLYNFTRFVEWPPHAFAGPRAPLHLCVLGEDPFGKQLDDLVTGEEVSGHSLVVRRPQLGDDLEQCHLLFVSGSEKRRFDEILAPLKGKGVFTVGEEDGFLEAGGILRFVLVGNKVRFRINRAEVERSPFVVSSKLMRLAEPTEPPLEGAS
jgi:hypothetical protein